MELFEAGDHRVDEEAEQKEDAEDANAAEDENLNPIEHLLSIK